METLVLTNIQLILFDSLLLLFLFRLSSGCSFHYVSNDFI